ncbi:MAG TPA: hypothetical protein VG099_09850, partial [Gemmataceae bacterium]|nr:hypothetical protein [Gemmataceae bacterium]
FASISPAATQKLLGYLAPLVLGTIASHFNGKPMNAQGLASMFADQKASIASAIPSGLSLSDVPGLAAAAPAVRSAAREVEAKSPSIARWLLPLAGIAALAALLWAFLPASAPIADVQRQPVTRGQSPEIAAKPVVDPIKAAIPDVSKFKTELTDTFSKLTEALASVKDVPSAEAALPKLEDLEGKLDVAKTSIKDLGAAGKATIGELVNASMGKLKALVEKVLAIPGVGDKIKSVTDSIMTKLSDLST